jgi:hypothetical protein
LHTLTPPDLFAAVRRLAPRAIIQVNHPWLPGYGYFHRASLDERTGAHWKEPFSFEFDVIEVINGYDLPGGDVPGRNLSRYFDLIQSGRRYTAVGSSDSHKLTSEWAGYPRTYVRVAHDQGGASTADEIADALRAGRAVVSLGPFVDARVGLAGPGDTVEPIDGTVRLDVAVRAPSWVDVTAIDVVVDGNVEHSFDAREQSPLGDLRWTQVIDVPVTDESWVAVVVRGERPMQEVLPGLHVAPFAFTNPIHVRAPPSGGAAPGVEPEIGTAGPGWAESPEAR